MTLEDFKKKVSDLQNTPRIGENPSLRRFYYELFDDFYTFLERGHWAKENVIEHGEPNEDAHFQNVAEAYYRLGYYEVTFYYFSKLVYDLWYQKTLEYQVVHSERVHKGTPVHQIAIILDHLSDKETAWNYFLAGLVEDLVTRRTMESSQAFRMLRTLGMPRAELELLKSKVGNQHEILDPLAYINLLLKENVISTYNENKSVDYNKLKQAEILWRGVKTKRGG